MPKAISNTSPLLYLHRLGTLGWLPALFDEVWIPHAVVAELQEGKDRGYGVPDPNGCASLTQPLRRPSGWPATLVVANSQSSPLRWKTPRILSCWTMP